MSISDLGALGEFIGSVAVLLTLIYLAKQVKDNSKLINSAVYESYMSSYTELNQAIATNPDTARVVMPLLYEGEEPPSRLDAFRVNQFARWFCNNLVKMHRLYERGMLPEDDWDITAKEAYEIMTSTDIGRNFMKNNHFFDGLWQELQNRADSSLKITNFGAE